MPELLSHPATWATIAAAAALVAYMVFEANWLEVTRTTLTFDRLPPAFEGLRIVLVSDFHSRQLGRFERRVIEQVGRIEADLLVIAGDLKARSFRPNGPGLALVDGLLDATKRYAFKPVYARGNHDRRGLDVMIARRGDIEALLDRSITLRRNGQQIAVAGVQQTARQLRLMRPSLRRALRGAPRDGFTILVSHSPDFFRMAARRGADLVLSGDTHGGQICLPYLKPVRSKSRLGRPFNRGHRAEFGSQIYVTRGVGTTGPRFRLLCRPEISVLTLRRREDKEMETITNSH